MEDFVCCRKYISNRKKILKEYMERTNLLNKNIEIKILEKKITGKIIGINDTGGLIILKENQKIETVYNGELKILS